MIEVATCNGLYLLREGIHLQWLKATPAPHRSPEIVTILKAPDNRVLWAHLNADDFDERILDTTGNIKVAQEILGHSHLSTTADLCLRVDQQAMVTALERVKANTGRAKKHRSWPSAKAAQYVFEYDDE